MANRASGLDIHSPALRRLSEFQCCYLLPHHMLTPHEITLSWQSLSRLILLFIFCAQEAESESPRILHNTNQCQQTLTARPRGKSPNLSRRAEPSGGYIDIRSFVNSRAEYLNFACSSSRRFRRFDGFRLETFWSTLGT